MSTDGGTRGAAAVLAAALGAVVLQATPATAHAVLTSSQPQRGATVEEPLEAVRLEFSEPVGFAQVQVTGPEETRVDDGTPAEEGTVVTQPVAAPLPRGVYRVAFRVTSDDGHPVEDAFEFTYEGPVGTAGQDGASPVRPEEARDVGLAAPVLIVVLLALVGFAVAAVVASRRRRGADGDGAWRDAR